MIARGILHDRVLRRKMITQLVIMLIVLVALGSWVIDDWLRDGMVRFAVFWSLIMFYTLFILLMAFYDILKAVKEEGDDS